MSDKSRQYLGMIFGGSVGPIILSDEHNVVIGKLFAQLNTVVFVLGTLMVGYITVVSTLNTAKEGHAMGQKWSSMWVPLRAVLGLLIMVPTPVSGYSTIQVTVMWFVLQGIGAANSVWQVALDAIGSGLSVTSVKGFSMTGSNGASEEYFGANPTQAQQIGQVLSGDTASLTATATQLQQLQQIMQGSFQAAVCSKFVNRFVEINQSDPLQLTQYNSQNTGGGQVSFYMDPNSTNKIKIGFEGGNISGGGVDFTQLCGSTTIQCHNADGSDGNCTDSTKIGIIFQGLNAVYQNMLALADSFFSEIDAISKPLNAQNAANDIVQKLGSNSGLYEALLGQFQTTIVQMAPPVNDASIINTINGAKNLGWIHAGSYYMTLGTLASAIVNNGDYILVSDPSYGKVPTGVGSDTVNYLAYKGISSDDVVSILTNVNGDMSLTPNSSLSYDTPIYDMMTLSSSAPKVAGSPITTFFNSLLIASPSSSSSKTAVVPHAATQSSGGASIDSSLAKSNKVGISAVSAIQSFQWAISQSTDPLLGIAIFGTSLMYSAESMIMVAFAASVVLSFSSIMSCPVSFKGVSDLLIVGLLFPAIAIAVLLWSTGAIFAVYMPMIPYLMFTATALGWMFSVVEAMVAAPLLALGFVMPSGDELGKAGQGLLILVGLFMKPTLMILSFILASRLLKAILTMINNMFAATVDASIAGVSPLLGWVVPTLVYAAFVVAITNKCFALIHILPEKVMRWIGAQGEGFGVEEVMQKAEQKTGEGVGAAQGVAKGAGESAQKRYADKKEERRGGGGD